MSTARTALRKVLQAHGAASELARKLEVTPNAVSNWERGKARPSIEMRAAIERETGGKVPAIGWLTKAERLALGITEARAA